MSVANSSLIQLIKQMAVEAVRASKPCDYLVGVVMETEPLKIKVSNTLVLEEDFLELTRNVTDYETVIENKKIKIHNALKVDDKILMLRKSGGQEFIVIDRVVANDTE